MANRLQLRRDGAQQWANINPILAQGELGIEIDTSRIKIGDGVTPWNSLRYERPLETESNTANTLVKRDADGNFEAGAITGSLVGNSATATRLANARQITLGGDMSGSGTFDGSANLTITAELNYQPGLPHYDANDLDATGTYTQITLDSRGRVTAATNPTTLSEYGIADAQAADTDLQSIADMTSFGLMSRQAEGTITTRTLTGGSGRLVINNGNGQSSNPFIDLADTTVVVGYYNPTGNLDTPLVSVNLPDDDTVNTTEFTVDRYGRLTQALTIPIATATQGSEVSAFDNSTTYARYAKVKNASNRLYEAIAAISSGGGEPTHTDTSDTGSWRYLGTAVTPQKGLASFNQEDFDVTAWNPASGYEGGFVTIAENGVDNLQLQNNRISFADGNTKEDFELDQELTSTTGYRGFNYLNYTKVNDTTGNLLFGVNNTGDGSGGTQQLVTTIAVTVGVDNVGGQATGVFYLDAVEKPSIGLKKGVTYIFDQSDNSNEVYNGMNHPLMFSTGSDGDHNGNGHYMDGVTYKLDGAVVTMAGYVSGFDAATTRVAEILVQTDAPASLYYWCHHHTGQGNSLTITDGGAGEVDINVRTYFSDADITLDGAIDQALDKTGDGNLTFQHTQNTTENRTLLINATNAGSGNALINITSENDITINATNVANRVNVEDFHFQDNVISTTNSTLIIDPNDDDGATGLVRVRGDLQVDGTTTTVNSTTLTVQDPIITLGGEDTLVSDDNLDRGVEFRYYDTQERFGFFGWDEDYADSNIWSGTGGYRFLYNATNSSETFTGTDAPIIGGNLRLTTNTSSTWKTPTTGTLVVTGGAGISENLNVGGTTHLNGNVEIDGTVDIDANFAVRNGTTDKVTIESATGNTVIEGTVDIQLQTTITDGLLLQADNKKFEIKTAGGTSVFDIDTDNGNTHTDGTLDVDSAVTFNSTLDVDSGVTFNSTLDVDNDSVFHDDITLDTTGKNFKITNGTDDKFTVLSTNGNTDIRGTLTVGSAVVLENTFQVDGNATIGNQSSDTLTVNSDTTLTDNLTVNQAVDFDSTLNVDQAVDFNSTLTVDGTTTVYDSIILQSDNEVFNINNASGQIQFAVDSDNGNTIIGRVGQGTGTLTVHGDATFNDNTQFTDNVTIGNANTDTLTVNSNTTLTDDVRINGSLIVDTNATIEGNLTVNGTTSTVNSTVVTLDDPIITLGGDTAPSSDDAKDRGVEFRYYDNQARLGFFGWDNSAERYALYHAATNSSEAFSGTRSGLDAGSLKLFDTTNATNSATGTLIVGGGVGIGLDLYVGDDLVVTDDGSFGGDVSITGTLDVTNDFAVNSTKFTVASATGNTIIQGTVQVDGNATIGNASGDSHVVTGGVTFNQAIISTDITADNIKIGVDGSSEISTTSGNLILDSAGGTVNITDDADVDGDLNVDGNTKVDGTLTVDGNTTIGNASGDAHEFTGTVTFNQAITSTDITADAIKIGVDANNEISTTTGNLVLDSQAGKVHITDNAEVDGNLQVDSNTTLGDSSSDTLTVNATSTFNAAITSTDITADNIQIGVSGSSEIDTSLGNLTIDSATGETIVDDNLTVSGTADINLLTTITDGLVVKADNKQVQIQTAAGLDKFTIDTDNGNTDIQGTLNVEGATTIDDTFNVTQATDLDSTLNVDGAATFQDNVTINADNKTFKIQNNSGVDKFTVDTDNGNVVTQGTLEVTSTTTLVDNVTAQARVDLTKNENPTSLTANAPLMIPNGGATIGEDVFIGQTLKLGPNAAETITLAGTTGNATIGGTLGVTGITTLTTLNLGSLTSSGAANIGGSLIVNTNKFSVASATGNTDIAGTLDVVGATVIDDTLNVTQNVDFDADLNVDGNLQLDGTLTLDSTSLFKDNIVLKGSTKTLKLQNGSSTTKIELQSTSGNIIAGGLTTTNSLDVTTNTTIGGTLGVTGQITGNLTGDLTGTADKTLLSDITDTTTSNLTYFPTFVSTNNGFTEIRTDSTNLTYNPSTNRLTVANFRSTTDFEVQGNLNITGNILYGQSQVGDISNHDTDALTEGSTNLYFTDERVDDRVNSLIVGGTGITATYDDAGNMLTLSATQADINTDNITEGSTNLFTTAARTRSHFTYGTGITHNSGTLSVTQADIDTDNVTEGSTNLFTTAARTRGHISVSGDLGYNASTGVISYTIPTTIASLSNHDTDDVAEGATNKYYTDERVDDRIDALIIAGTGVTKVYDDGANTYTLSVTQADVNTDTVTEGSTNLFTTAARTRTHFTYGTGITHSSGTLSVTQSDINTDNITEGSTNVFFTNARADARVVAGITGKLDASAISTFGLTLVDDADASAARSTLGLGSAAESNTGDFATAAQGTLAASATQPGDLATVATSGAYNDLTGKPTLFSGAYSDLTGAPSLGAVATSNDYDDLSNKPTLGTAAATASTAYATAAQGTKADANDTDIDDIYTQLVAIGNNNAITTVAQLKTALLALARS